MPIALGLDAGGTYTDAVLYDLSEDRILASAKAPTTPPSYIEGVAGAIAGLPAAIRSRATYAALSTTLATNAIVEGRHAPAGLV
ncbi:MAG TPA: hydantoinase/oxoprolinase N-terminal domain-containing protein, partial [Candidatus Latescibacteria bacterium]|nr:hydantoinase/oxoprolinase N-terminal domain-containing protein [Candidatus Latescibacterota bacterium]